MNKSLLYFLSCFLLVLQINNEAKAQACTTFSYCASAAGSTFDDEIFNVSIGTLNSTSTCTDIVSGAGSVQNSYANYAGVLAPPNLTAGSNYTLSVTAGQCNGFAYSGIIVAFIDYNQNGSFTDAGETIYTSAYSAFAVTGTTFTTVITIPATAVPGVTRMRVIADETSVPPGPCDAYTWGETEDYCVNIVAAAACAGAPGANSAVSSMTTVCPGGSAVLSLANSYTVGGLTYQWYSASSSTGPYTSIGGANASSYNATGISASTWYQAVITCTNGPASTTSTPVQVQVGGNSCMCTAYCSSSATSTADDEIFNVSIGTLNNSSTCSQTGGLGSSINRYSNYSGIVGAPNLVAGSNYTLSVTVGMCGGFGYSGVVTAYMDFNQNGVFTDAGELVYTSPFTAFAIGGTAVSTVITIPAGAVPGITRMRVIEVESSVGQASCGSYTWGETEDYCVNIQAAAACAGAPGSNSVVASATAICPSGSVSLSLANSYTVGGLTYQWQASATGAAGSFTNISGATLSTYNATNITSTTYYQAVITCTNGPASTTATAVQIVPTPNPCACTAYCPSAATSTADDEIFNVSLGTLNNTSTCSQTGGTGSLMNRYSNYTGMVAAPNLTLSNTYTLSITAGQCGGFAYSGIITAFIDYNQNGLFTDAGEAVYTSTYTSWAVTGTTFTTVITVPTTASLGVTRMRIIAAESTVPQAPCASFTWGEVEDYCVNLMPSPPCSGASGGTQSTASYMKCNGETVILSSAGASTGTGTTYQWQVSSTPGGPYSNVSGGSGATTTTHTTGVLTTGTYYYVLQTTCSTASLSGISNEATVSVNPLPSVSVSPLTTSLCVPGASSVALTASGASSYTWSPAAGLSGTTGVSVNALPGTTTTYSVIGATAAGCTASATASISVNEAPSLLSISATPTVFCAGQSSSLTASGALTSSYTITSIPFAPIPTPSTGVTSLCASGVPAIPLTAGTLDDGGWINQPIPFNFSMYGNAYSSFALSTNGFIRLGAGPPNTYTGYGNMFPSAFAARPVIGAVYGDLDFSSMGTIEYFTDGTSPNQKLVINWSGQFWSTTGTVVTQAVLYEGSNMIEVHTFTSTGTNNAVQGIQDAAGTAAHVVTGRNAVNWTVSSPDAYRWTPDGGPVSYSWGPSTFLSATNISNPVANNMTNTTTYTVSLSSANGCTNTGVQTISVTPGPTISIAPSSTAICTGSSATLTANGATSYTWSSGPTTPATVESPTITTTYTVTGDAAGCIGSETISLVVNANPTVTAASSTPSICSGSSATLTATGATTYSWSSGAMTASTVESPGSSATYTVIGDNSGCTGSATVALSVTSTPTITAFASPSNVCAGQTTTLMATGAPSYTWNTGAMTPVTVDTPTANTVYTVSSDNGGCIGTSLVPVTVAPGVTVSVANTPTMLCSGSSATLIASGASSYTWSTGTNAVGIIVSPTITTNYTVTGDNGGCTGAAVITQSVTICSGIQALGINSEIELYPNPTQNMLHILVPDLTKETKFELYDAVGRVVMTMELKENHTTLNMIELPGGIYNYRINSGEVLLKQGKLVRE
jgi:hypothetical protein